MRKILALASVVLMAGFFAHPARADWDHNHHEAHQDTSNWYQGHWWYGAHRDSAGWWWITPGNGWYIYQQPVYPYPDPPYPMAPPVIVQSPAVITPPAVVYPYPAIYQ